MSVRHRHMGGTKCRTIDKTDIFGDSSGGAEFGAEKLKAVIEAIQKHGEEK